MILSGGGIGVWVDAPSGSGVSFTGKYLSGCDDAIGSDGVEVFSGAVVVYSVAVAVAAADSSVVEVGCGSV